ncbi:MAG TPA: DUF2125 domain-containing protein [Rhizomicrobium sp.]
MNYSSRFWLYAPITVFLLIAAGVMVHWKCAADAFEQKLAALKGHQAIPGVTLDWSSVAVSGFPFRLDADFEGLSLKGAGAHGPFAWGSEKFALHRLTYGRAKSVFEAAGRQHVTWTDASGIGHAADFLPGSLRGGSVMDGRGLTRFDVDIVDAGAKNFTIGELQFHMRRDPNGADLDLMLKADAVNAGGVRDKLVQVYATLSRAGALAPLLRGDTAWPQAMTNWRAQGGRAKLSQVIAPGLAADGLLSPLY